MTNERTASQVERLVAARVAVEERMTRVENGPKVPVARNLKMVDVPEGTFEAAFLTVREALPEQYHDDDFEWWEGFDRNATTTSRNAVFKYYLKGVKHDQLAHALLQSIPRVGRALFFNDITDEEYHIYHGRLASHLLQYYPKKYRSRYGQSA